VKEDNPNRPEGWRAAAAADERWPAAHTRGRLGLVLFWAVFALAVWLRWQIRGSAISSDECALVDPPGRGSIGFFNNIEWARNSPLFPFLFSFIPDLAVALQWGRDAATISGLAAVAAVYLAARRATGGDALSGALASAIVAFDPVLAYESVTFRPYGIWALVESWRLACLCGLLAESSDTIRPHVWNRFVVLTCLLPWTHYASFAILTFEAVLFAILLPARRWVLKAHAIAAVTALPLIAFVVYMRNSPDPTGGALGRAIEIAFARHVGGHGWRWIFPFLAFVLAIVLSGSTAARAVLTHWLAIGAAALLLSATTLVRPAVAALGVPAFAIAVPTAISVLRGRARYVGLAAASLLVFANWPFAHLPPRDYGPAREAADIAAFASDLRRESHRGTWNVFPDWNFMVLNVDLHMNGAHVEVPAPDLMQVGEARLRPFRDLTKPPPGHVIIFSCNDQLAGCTATGGRSCAKTYECP